MKTNNKLKLNYQAEPKLFKKHSKRFAYCNLKKEIKKCPTV